MFYVGGPGRTRRKTRQRCTDLESAWRSGCWDQRPERRAVSECGFLNVNPCTSQKKKRKISKSETLLLVTSPIKTQAFFLSLFFFYKSE